MKLKMHKDDSEWRHKLTPEQYRVCREKGTEPAFTGQYWDDHNPGIYDCACCGKKLFSAESKFDSGTGWPSFTNPIKEDAVIQELDNSHNMWRTEVLCSDCGAHLGHVFDDGPGPNHQRYCINSVALKKEGE